MVAGPAAADCATPPAILDTKPTFVIGMVWSGVETGPNTDGCTMPPAIPVTKPDPANAGAVWSGAVTGPVKGDCAMPPAIPVAKAAPAGIGTVWSGVVAGTYHNGVCTMSHAVSLIKPVLDSTLR